jgi:hypothetical protein
LGELFAIAHTRAFRQSRVSIRDGGVHGDGSSGDDAARAASGDDAARAASGDDTRGAASARGAASGAASRAASGGDATGGPSITTHATGGPSITGATHARGAPSAAHTSVTRDYGALAAHTRRIRDCWWRQTAAKMSYQCPAQRRDLAKQRGACWRPPASRACLRSSAMRACARGFALRGFSSRAGWRDSCWGCTWFSRVADGGADGPLDGGAIVRGHTSADGPRDGGALVRGHTNDCDCPRDRETRYVRGGGSVRCVRCV